MNLIKAAGLTHKTKRISRGRGGGMGKIATKRGKSQTARKSHNEKKGFEGGQQPFQRRLPKIGLTSKIAKSYVINVEKTTAVKEPNEITIEGIKNVHKISKLVTKIKLISASAKDLASKIKDESISVTGSK